MPKPLPNSVAHVGSVSTTTSTVRVSRTSTSTNQSSLRIESSSGKRFSDSLPNSGRSPAIKTTTPLRANHATSHSSSSRRSPHTVLTGDSIDRSRSSMPADAGDHKEWLEIPIFEVNINDPDQQSLRSAVLEPQKHIALMDLVSSQRNSRPASTNTKRDLSEDPTSAKCANDLTPPALERSGTVHSTATDASRSVGEMTQGSDDGLYSDHTAPAVYMTAKPAGNVGRGTNPNNLLQIIDLSLLRLLSDEQLHKLESYVQFEKESRRNRQQSQEAIDLQAVEARKGMKRSKSGGVELIFHNRSQTVGHSLFSHQESLPQKTHLDVLTTVAVDSEDLEVGSLFDNTPSLETRGTYSPMGTTPSSSSIRVISRSSGAFHPNDKMFGISPNNGAPSPAVCSQQNNTHSPAVFLSSSPLSEGIYQANRPPSRLGATHLSVNEDGSHFSRTKRSIPASNDNNSANLKPIASVQMTDKQKGVELSADGADAIALAGSLDNLILQNRNREKLAVSPFSAFDDCSVGSHSINSSRSSKTRRMYEGNLELGSPTSHFSKRIAVSSTMGKPIDKDDYQNKKHRKFFSS